MSSHSMGALVAMTEFGFANEMGSGKVRWRAVQENLKGALVSGTGSNITALAVSGDSEWLAYGRRNVGVAVLKIHGGTDTEIVLPMTNSGLGGTVSALYVHKTGSGKIASYVVYAGDQQGVLCSWTFKDDHSIANPHVIATELGAITAIHPHLDELFVAVKDGTKVVKIALSSGRPHDEFPPCASPPIRLISVAKHINALVVATQHRHLSVYSLLDHKSVQYLSGESAPLFVQISPHLFEQEYQHVLGVTELGEIAIWKVSASTESKKPLQPSIRVKLDSASTRGHVILCATFSHARRGAIILAFGTPAKPQFTDVSYMDDDGSFLPKLSITSTESNTLLEGSSAASFPTTPNGKESNRNGKDESRGRLTGALDAPIAHTTFKGVPSATSSSLDSAMQVDGPSYPQDSAEIPFAQLVKQQFKTQKSDKSASSTISNTTGTGSATSGIGISASGSKLELPRATSAVAALVAALSTNDRAQLNLILAKHDEQFITSTLRQLPVSQVLPLLTELLSSFATKASLPIIAWTRHLLILHQSYLASAPDLINKLSGLYNTVDERLKNFPDLLKLSGRFDLLLAHLRDQDSDDALGKRALQTYVEEDDDLDMPEYEDDEDGDDDEEHSEDLSDDDGGSSESDADSE